MKSLFQRLLLPRYLMKTIQVKKKRWIHETFQKNNPYDTISPTVTLTKVKVVPKYLPFYHSLSHIDLTTAEAYYGSQKSIIHTIMLALFEYNEMEKNGKIDVKRLETLAQEIIGLGEVEGYYLYFYIEKGVPAFDILGRHISGIVQAKAASFLLRCFEATDNDNYLSWARMSLLACTIKVEDEGVFRLLHNEISWVEEYSSPTPSMVLNGYMFYVIALSEYCGLVSDPEVEAHMADAHDSLLSWLPYYFVGEEMLYSMYRWSFCNIHYLSVCQYLLEHLFQLTSNNEYNQYATKIGKMTDDDTFKKLFV